jgi:exopolysaccharide biosynthesis WecB/TagA/CpsF family protein
MTARHVAFYMHDLSGGGVERMRLALIAALRARGVRTTLVVGAKTGPLVSLLPADLTVVELGCAGTVAAVKPLARFLRSARPDVLVASLDHNNITALLAGRRAASGARIVICQHNALSAERARGWRYRAVPFLYRLLQRDADGVVAVSQGVAADLASTARIPAERITVIHNPVITPDFADRMQGAPPHPWLADRDCPVFVFAGRLTPQKDPETLLRAMARLVADTPARLIVLGEGELRDALALLACRLGISDDVCFCGFQANPLPWLRHATACVSSSRYEGLGNVIIEALACGTPVIACDCPYGPSEILLGGAFGRLVPVGDPDALAEAMAAQLRADPHPETLRMRAAGFTAAACAQAHLSLFEAMDAVAEKTVRALGMQVSPLSVDQVAARIMSGRPPDRLRLVVTPNIEHVRLLRRADFAAAYAAADLVCPDGFPVLMFARWRGLAQRRRVTGCDVFHHIARHPALADRGLFLVLESQGTADAAIAWAARLGIGGRVHVAVAPPDMAYDPVAQWALVEKIEAASAAILVMTLGAPLSEVFVHTHREALPRCWALCLGQAVRVELGLTRRAPLAWRGLGLEWLWRLWLEPRRLAARYVLGVGWFLVAVVRDVVGGDGKKPEEAVLL